MPKLLIIGATSAIAEATAKLYAQPGNTLFLLARSEERLASLASDLKVRGADDVLYEVLDVNDFPRHKSVIEEANNQLQGIDIALIAHGTLPDQKKCEQDVPLAVNEISVNAVSTLSLLSYIANLLEQQKSGTIVAISSVAGDRGRQSNYIYGASKGAVSIFLQGLRNRLFKSGVNVITIKPGFVDTPMTAELKKGLLWAKPEDIAQGIKKSIDKKKSIVYLPSFWWLIMFIIKSIPERIFKRLSL